jgi:hypothetical protein
MIRTRIGQALRYSRAALRALLSTPPSAQGGERERQSSVAHAAEDYNAAAERHWATLAADPQARRSHLQKPFANPRETPAMLYRLGLALEALASVLGIQSSTSEPVAAGCRSY